MTKRLYVGGLSHTITQKDLKDRFGKFGEVEDVELRTRTDDEGVPYKTFGYININISDGDLKRCMTVLNKSKWKGGTLAIETARESTLDRLAQERKELVEQQQSPAVDQKEKVLESLRKAGVENFHMKAAVPGTEVPGHKDWVVSKFGRVLPVLNLKCRSGRDRTVTMDPSKHSHNIKKLDPPSPTQPTPISELTWEIQGGDDEMSKKRRGEFPPHKPKKPKRTRVDAQDAPVVSFQTDVVVSPRVSDANGRTNGSVDQTPTVASRPRPQTPFPENSLRNRLRVFDGMDSDEDIQRLVAQQSSQGAPGQDAQQSSQGAPGQDAQQSSQGAPGQDAQQSSQGAPGQDAEVEEDFLEVVGDDYLVTPGWGFDKGKGERDGEDYDSADTDEILTSRKTPSNQQEEPTKDDKPETDTAKRKKVVKKKKKKKTAGKEEEHNDSADTDEILTSKRPKKEEKETSGRRNPQTRGGSEPDVVPVAEPPSSEPDVTKKKKKVMKKKVIPVAKPPSSEPDVMKKKKKVMKKKVIPVAKPPSSESDSDDDDDGDDDDEEESNNGGLSDSKAVNGVKGEKKPKKKPDSSESDDCGGDSDYEAMFSNCVRLEISFSDLQQVASLSNQPERDDPDSDTEPGPSQTSSKTTLPSIPSATTPPETSIPTTQKPTTTTGASKPSETAKVPEKVPKKGTTPEEILASIMEDDSSEDEKKMKKKKKKKSVVSLPAFQGTKGLTEREEADESLKRRKDEPGQTASKKQKLNTQPPQPIQTKPSSRKDTRTPAESSSEAPGSSSSESGEEEEAETVAREVSKTAPAKPLRKVTALPEAGSSSCSSDSSEEETQATVSASKDSVKVPAKQLPKKAAEPETESSSSSSSSDEEEEAKSSQPVSTKVSLKVGTKQPPKAVKPKAGSSSSSSSSEDDEDEGDEEEAHRTQTVATTKDATVEVLAKKPVKAATAKTVPETDTSSSETSSSEEEEEEEEGSKMSKPTQRPERTIGPHVDEESQKRDNLRRLAAMEQRVKETEQHKKLIQGALANVDIPAAGKGKHIVFGSDNDDSDDDDDDEEGTSVAETPKKTLFQSGDEDSGDEAVPANKKAVKEKSIGSKLFDSEGEDDEEAEEDGSRFQIKPQFEGKSGQKLMALQSRFGTDQRFQMDSRFMEEGDEQEEEGAEKQESVKEGGEDELEEEKKKNLSILGSVLNINIQPANKTAKKSKTFRDVSALHYDPTREEHAAFETKPDDTKKESKASRKKKREEAEKAPEVSKEIYYDVSVDLKEVFGAEKEKTADADKEKTSDAGGEEKIGWDKDEEEEEEEETDQDQALLSSLLSDPGAGKEKEETSGFKFSFFGDDLEADSKEEKAEYHVELIHGPKVSWQLDPRLRDSSSGEEEEEEEVEKEKEEQSGTAKTTEEPAHPKRGFFFFCPEDDRLKEGPRLFYRSCKLEEQREEWEEKRTSLREEYRKKHKDARRKLKTSSRA